MIDFDVTTDDRGIGVVTPRGRLNMVAARQLRQILADLVDNGNNRIVVDLAQTTFVDSSGLGALIGGLKAARQGGGDLRITDPAPTVMAVLELTNLDKLLRPRASVESAFDV